LQKRQIRVILHIILEPSPPATRLLGKSDEYVAVYTDCYREEGKKIQTKNALTGCLVGMAVELVFYTLYFLILFED